MQAFPMDWICGTFYDGKGRLPSGAAAALKAQSDVVKKD
eukprot:SAG31_NODE_3342_length_4383_cov_5.306723_4_plen_39_part_00